MLYPSGISLGHMNQKINYSIILILFACLLRLCLFVTENGILWPDSVTYLNWAKDIAESLNFANHPTYRTPAYPSFLAFFFWIFPYEISAKIILLTQYILGIFSTYFFYQTFKTAFSEKIAFYSALLFSINPLELYYETVIQTEALFVPLFALSMWKSFIFIKNSTKPNAIYLGLSMGLLCLTRPLAQLLLIFVLLITFVFNFKNKRVYSPIILSFAVYFLSILPWQLVNLKYYGFFGVSKDVGLNLFHRTFDVDKLSVPSSKHDTFHLLAMSERDSNRNAYFYVLRKLRSANLPYVKIDKLMLDYALELIKANRAEYIENSVVTFVKFFFSPDKSITFCKESTSYFLCHGGNHSSVKFTDLFPQSPQDDDNILLRKIIYYYFNLWTYFDLILGYLFLLGLYFSFRKFIEKDSSFYLLIGVTFYFALIVSFFNSAEDRFRLSVVPLMLPIAILAITNLQSLYQRKKLRN